VPFLRCQLQGLLVQYPYYVNRVYFRSGGAAPADRYPRDEVARTLMRLAVTDRLAEIGGKYTLPSTE
jgi:hypothetical protein